MMSTSGRPTGRFFFCLILAALAASVTRGAVLPAAVVVAAADTESANGAPPSQPATTLIQDVVYRGNGTPAAGVLLISWPAFATSDKKAVAAGSLSVTLAAGGALSLALVPNQGATPAGTYYKVLYKLDEIKARFARFESMEACFRARDAMILRLPCYAEARASASDPEKFVRALARHWATDTEYAEKILQIRASVHQYIGASETH